MSILESLNSYEDIKTLDEAKLAALCEELRRFVVDITAENGGHLSSNLGVVELTVAIHRVFDTRRDRLLFDVGHQSYIHKILTGRRREFPTLRSFGGISGFPKPEESVHDAFVAGHASSAISTALGMARARTLMGQDYDVIALVGDGALTGGLAYEGLCDAGASREKMIVILNDNGMSIDKNVGAMARHLARQRLKHGYVAFKNGYRRLMRRIPGGNWLYGKLHTVKQAIKEAIFHCSMFEDMGFSYLGPVDGHNLRSLEAALRIAKDTDGPTLVHVITKKGKGCQYAEVNPDAFHGVRRFDPATGLIPRSPESFSDVFGQELCAVAAEDKRLIAVTAAMIHGTGLTEFSRRFPDRFFDVGICEGHAVSMIGGAANQGAIPVFAVYSTFLQRSYDMILQDLALGREHAVLAVDRAGLSGEDGETHQGSMDISYLTSVPNMTVWSPASFAELRDMLRFAIHRETGPVAVRYPKGGEGRYTEGGVAPVKRVGSPGDDVTLVTYGVSVNTAMDVKDRLAEKGVAVDLIKLGRVKPLDLEAVAASVARTGRIAVLEESVAVGCLGQQLISGLTRMNVPIRSAALLNLGDRFIPHGSVEEQRALCGIDATGVEASILELIGGTGNGKNKA